MSTTSADPSASTSQSNFASIFNAALESYKRKTKKDLASHPLLPDLQSCESPEAVLAILREQVPCASNQSRDGEDGLTKWITPTVNVLYSFSGTIGQGVGLVNLMCFFVGNFCPNRFYFILQAFPPASVIFAGIDVLLFVSVPTSCLFATLFDANRRRLKMRAIAKTSLSRSSTGSNISSADLRYILASPRLGP